MQTLIDFITFKDPNVIYVVLGMICINTSSAVIGTFAFLRKRALIGDAIAHALLPGVCLGFILAGDKNIIYLLGGAFLTGWLATFLVDYIVNQTKIKQDAAIGIVLSTLFAFGIVLMSVIQNGDYANEGGLNNFLFGQAAAINKDEVYIFGIILLVILVATYFFYRAFLSISFNYDFAASAGLPVKTIEFVLTSLTVLAIAAGIQALGVVLMSALIITPAAAARFWSNNLRVMLLIAVVFSVFSGVLGAYVSYANAGVPTGPWVVLILSLITIISFVFSTKKGILYRILLANKNKRKIFTENILKSIFQWHEKKQKDIAEPFAAADLLSVRLFSTRELNKGLVKLKQKGLLVADGTKFYLSAEGIVESKRIVRLHRLWEHYLLRRTSMDENHVHAGAEAIEHVLSPEIEKELEKELGILGIPKDDY
ncbi:metal ABC transporter permease [Crocinitomix catalasitica]|uniref:metal ABC transporter permease n=1 Tax=Crocinitomix catalasitica TaxID=184607 RepID=UPI00056B3E7F|nr:iron chelate uptake ABC transporter family permease subunit [Crocinitomix catalasitica]